MRIGPPTVPSCSGSSMRPVEAMVTVSFWVDRTTGICASMYTNSLPFITENDAWRTYGEFEEAVYAAL